MLPQHYELPVAALLVVGGVLACFAGHRLLRVVLGMYGFMLGAMFTSSLMGGSNVVGMVAGALVGGAAGALIMVFAYFIGVALVGAGLGALIAHLTWRAAAAGDPPPVAVVMAAVAGAVGAMLVKRYVIIVATAFSGAWTIIVGTLMASGGLARTASTSDVWILYPMSPAPGQQWVPFAWVALGLLGTVVQLAVTARKA